MRRILYYCAGEERFNEVTKSWRRQGVYLRYQKPHLPAVEPVVFSPADVFPFCGNPGELSYFLSRYRGDLSSLIVVVGKMPAEKASAMETELNFLLLSYPEVNFFFEDEETIPAKIRETKDLCLNLLCPCRKGKDILAMPLEKMLLTENLFDAANVRSAVKEWKQEELSIENIFSSWRHRKESPVIVVDEEREQCLFNSYLLFANGFRSFPISSFHQLRSVFTGTEISLGYKYVFRDFDLQFPDEDSSRSFWMWVDDGEPMMISMVDFVRGFKVEEDEAGHPVRWIDLTDVSKVRIAQRMSGVQAFENQEDYHTPNEERIWKREGYKEGKILVVTQGYSGVEPRPSPGDYTIDGPRLTVPGLKKPLEGVFYDLHQIESIRKDFWKGRKEDLDPKRSRKGREHSAPLNLFDIASAITARAKRYYREGRFILSAVLSREALEILNGFNITLTIQAYHLHAVSENAIAMSVIGGNEEKLEADCRIRARIIDEDVRRLIKGTEQDPQNVLNQIFSDCRLYCKEKEHFKSETVFVSEMAHLNEGIHLLKPIDGLIDKLINRLQDEDKREDKGGPA